MLIVIATLGQRPSLLKKTLESITDQKVQNLDIVLVYPLDDKATEKLADQYNAKKLADPGGMSAAVNIGIKSASSEHKYVTWIGDDDLLMLGSLSATLGALEGNPSAVAAFGHCRYIDENDHPLITSKAGLFAPWVITWGPNLIPLPGSLFRLSTLLELEYIFDESLKYAMDLDLFLRLSKKGKLINTGTLVSSFRWHSTSITVVHKTKSLKEAEIVKRRYLPKYLHKIAPLWEVPVRAASHSASRRVNSLATRHR